MMMHVHILILSRKDAGKNTSWLIILASYVICWIPNTKVAKQNVPHLTAQSLYHKDCILDHNR